MATNTTNYGWTKPSYEDAADIEVINGTIDNIDAQVKTVENAIPTTLAELSGDSTHRTVTDTEKATWNAKADVADIPTVPITAIQKNGIDVTPVSGTVNIIVPTTAADVSALPDTTKYATALSLTINSSTFVMTGQLKDQNGDNLGTAQTIDLPLESVVVGGSYDSATKKVVLTLQSGSTVEFSVADLVAGLQTELSASNKLNPAFINYDSTHRAVSDAEKTTWNNKSDFSGSYNDLTDKPTIPEALSDLSEDSTHRTVSDVEKSVWNGKQSALSTAQLAAANSGIDSTKVAQIETNKNNISLITPELIELVDSGSKNLANISFGTVTEGGVTAVVNSDGYITLNGTRTSSSALVIQASNTPIKLKNDTSYVCKGTNNSSVRVQVIGFSEDETEYHLLTNTNTDIAFDSENWHHYFIRILLTGAATFSDVTIYPMCCSKTAWDISQAYQPYRPSYDEIIARITALENA